MSASAEIIEKVSKLLRLANSTSANEAAVATAQANRLIDKYRISEIDLEMTSEVVEGPEEDQDYVYQTGRLIPWKHHLLSILVKHYGLAYFNSAHYPEGRKVTRFKLIGRKSDMAIAKYMFTWLMTECQRLSDLHAKGKGHVYVFSYCEGFVCGIEEQLKLSRAEIKKEASSAAMVKLDNRAVEANAFMRQQYNLRRGASSSHARIDGSGFSAGKEKGTSFHLGKAMGSVSVGKHLK